MPTHRRASNGWFVLTDIVAARRVDHLIRRLLPRLDLFGEPSLHACLEENGLHLQYYERDPGEFAVGLGLMSHCIAVARLQRLQRLQQIAIQ